jgi:hypothetical protein
MVLRWAEIILDFHAAKNTWKEKAAAEHDICPWMFQILFEEAPKQPRNPANDRDFVQCNANRIWERLALCMLDWPDLVIELHHVLRPTRSAMFELKVRKAAPRTADEASRSGKLLMARIGTMFLDKGREQLSGGHSVQSLPLFTMASRYYAEAMKPGQRWFENAPFQIVSNRARAAAVQQLWNLCRHDTRMTIYMQNDHIRSYERLP